MASAKVFKSGNRQAVRLPKQFRVQSKDWTLSDALTNWCAGKTLGHAGSLGNS